LSRTKEELNEMRQRLSDVQERLTVAEQVTAATQQRALQESDSSEQLELEITQQHQPTTPTGFWQIQYISDIKFVTFTTFLLPEIDTGEKCRNNIGLERPTYDTHIMSILIRLLFVAWKREQRKSIKV